jgi:hypothetical protein
LIAAIPDAFWTLIIDAAWYSAMEFVAGILATTRADKGSTGDVRPNFLAARLPSE